MKASSASKHHAYFEQICCRLNVDDDTSVKGWKVYKDILALKIKPMPKSRDAVGSQQLWTACALFIASVKCKQLTLLGDTAASGNCLRLTQLLKETGVRFSFFLEHVPFVFKKLGMGQEAECNLKILKEKFNVATHIFKKFKFLWDETKYLRQCESIDGDANDDEERHPLDQDRERMLLKFTWIFFLHAKFRITGGGAAAADLAKSYHVLVSSLLWVLVHSCLSCTSKDDLLKILSEKANVDILEMKHTDQQLTAYVASITSTKDKRVDSTKTSSRDCLLRGHLAVPMTDGGVLSPRYLAKNVASLSRAYESTHLVSVWEVNELFFLDCVVSNQICTPAKTRPALQMSLYRDHVLDGGSSDGEGHKHMSKRLRLRQHQLPPAKRARSSRDTGSADRKRVLLQTPVSAAVKARTWFTQTMASLDESPSTNLRLFFKACTQNPIEKIAKLVDALPRQHIYRGEHANRRLPNLATVAGDVAAVDTDVAASASLSSASSDAVRSVVFSPILAPKPGPKMTDHRLERCRSCCVRLYYETLEALLVTERHRLDTMNHEALLHNESFHRALLACCMEVALKSCNYVALAFPSTLETFDVTALDLCKMLESFIRHQPGLPSMLRRHLFSVEEQIIESMAWHEPKLQRQEGVDQSTPDGLPSKSVALLVRKTKRLAVERTVKLGRMLGLSNHVVEKMRETIEWAIEHMRSLLYDRHLDNTVLCVVYGVAKVMRTKPGISFKRIIKLHAKWNGAKLEVVRHIVLGNSNERGDVIQFYNKIFIPSMKSFLLTLQNPISLSSANGTDDANGRAKDDEERTSRTMSGTFAEGEVGCSATAEGSSPRRIENTNVYVMRRRASMTPRTRALYAFGESPRRDLVRINRAVNHDILMSPISDVFAAGPKQGSSAAALVPIEEFLRERHGKSLGLPSPLK